YVPARYVPARYVPARYVSGMEHRANHDGCYAGRGSNNQIGTFREILKLNCLQGSWAESRDEARLPPTSNNGDCKIFGPNGPAWRSRFAGGHFRVALFGGRRLRIR